MGYLYSFISMFCYAIPAVFIAIAYGEGLTPQSLIFSQSVIAAIIFSIYIRFDKESSKLTRKSIIDFIITGTIFKTGTIVGVFYAINYMDVSLAMTLVFMYPAIVILLEFLIDKKSLQMIELVGLVCTILGAALVMKVFQGDFHTISSLGIIFSLIGSLSFGGMIYWTNKKLSNYSPVVAHGYTTIFSIISIIIFVPPVFLFTGGITFTLLKWSLFFGTVNSVLAGVFLFAAIKLIGGARASIVSIFELPLTILFAFLLLNEQMDFIQILGGLFILSGIFLFEWKKIRVVILKSIPVKEL